METNYRQTAGGFELEHIFLSSLYRDLSRRSIVPRDFRSASTNAPKYKSGWKTLAWNYYFKNV